MVILGKVCNSVVVASFGKQYSSSELISQTCTCQILEALVINEEKPVSHKLYFCSIKEVVECSSKSFCIVITD